ncbi:hypothetical protein [Litoribacter populi]|uniref:hypothetical protein n=1 Tax=Litoribacter populi TaxID=2598460 RepID=UPI001180EBD5|nr:hypothetical protein [Litoribacter populi]
MENKTIRKTIKAASKAHAKKQLGEDQLKNKAAVKAISEDFEAGVKWVEEEFTILPWVQNDFLIIPLEKYESLMKAVKGIRNSMNVHPDCVPDSEFEGMVSRVDEILEKLP